MLSSELSKDMKILKSILSGNVKIEELDEETQIRLIILCKNRSNQLRQKLEEKKIETDIIKKLTEQLNNGKL